MRKLARRSNYLNIKVVVWEEGKRGEISRRYLAGLKALNMRLGGAVSIHLWKISNYELPFF